MNAETTQKLIINAKNPPSVKRFRLAGFKVRTIHDRFIKTANGVELLPLYTIKNLGYQKSILSKGGRTYVEIDTPNGINVEAEAVCSIKDSFNKKFGLQKALWRAADKLRKIGIVE